MHLFQSGSVFGKPCSHTGFLGDVVNVRLKGQVKQIFFQCVTGKIILFQIILLSSSYFSNQTRNARGSASLVVLLVGERIMIGMDISKLAQLELRVILSNGLRLQAK